VSQGREIRVDFAFELKGSGYCGGCYRGSVDVLVDGRKIVQDEDAGEAEAYEGSDQSSPVLTRVELESEDLIVCRTFGNPERDGGRVCRRIALPPN
jgi:hypothetical protein